MKNTQKTKSKLFSVIVFLIILLILFLILELIARLVVGNRLIVKVEPDGLFQFKPNQYGWYSYMLRIPHARINNIGARGEDINLSTINETRKFIFLGDSFTFGWERKENETIPSYFQKEFSDSVSINYGNGGFGIEHMISSYNFHKNLFNSGTVIMIIIEDDFYRHLVPYSGSFLKETFWKIKEKSSAIAWIWAAVTGTIDQIKNKNRSNPHGLDVFNTSGEMLVKFNQQVKNENKTLLLVFYEYNDTNYSNYAGNFCQRNGLRCITDVPYSMHLVSESGYPVFSEDKGHPSEYANEAVAQRITKYVYNLGN